MTQMKVLTAAVILVLIASVCSPAQTTARNGLRENPPDVHALVHLRIVSTPDKILTDATIIIRHGMITSAGQNIGVPPDARTWDCTGLTAYAGFIDACSDYGMPAKLQRRFGPDRQNESRQPEPAPGVRAANANIRSSTAAEEQFTPDPAAAEKLRSSGFAAVLAVPQRGIFRGVSAVISLADGSPNELVLRTNVAQHCSFETVAGEDYPNSLMGIIALMRQTFLDAQWYRQVMQDWRKYPSEPHPEVVADLDALGEVIDLKTPVVFETGNELNAFRAAAVAREFGLKYLLRGSGDEYRRLDAIRALDVPLIIPVNFPDAPDVQSMESALNVGFDDLRAWDEAPENPARLHAAGVKFALTSALLKDVAQFLPNVRKAVQRGLPAREALAALTTVPAQLVGMEKYIGSIEPGKLANIVLTDGDLFSEKTKIRETWIAGRRYVVKHTQPADPRGTWNVTMDPPGPDSLKIALSGETDALQGSVKSGKKEAKFQSVSFSHLLLSMSFAGDSLGFPGIVRMTAPFSPGALRGRGEFSSGKQFTWSATLAQPSVPEPDTAAPKPAVHASFPPTYPPGPFGRPSLPVQADHVFIHDATVWTSAAKGILEHADVLIEKGKIAAVGSSLKAPEGAVIIEGKGKQITAGLIDCHSHTAASGSVNETGHTITSEVRIGDIIDPDDVALYRELAGGLTVANVLHGSANPIGGQNQVIKLRWGALAEEMKFAGAKPGIKFALGENPKQSNWGDRNSRYPQTRQGVEEMIRDEFRAALDYEKSWSEYRDGTRKLSPRRDLHEEAILEIIRGKRLVHAHSYRQDEIEMLIGLADEFGFTVGTFQHDLEGYKIADLIAKHGAGASMFSDWWAYKFEVYDAIPYNGALSHDAGVVVSYNSDSDELARRLNSEAGKAVKYGGVPPEEAIKFVTINPARQLHIDARVGSLEPGKDADFVVWNGDPLSALSVCEQTWIDGRKYFDRDEDRKMNGEVDRERAVLIQKILAEKKGNEPSGRTRPPGRGRPKYSCHEDLDGKEGF
ncbi:MAG TPA: amidohydrolase family protein [Bacteroidota bacterium]|nr:amidohydrolase family protein [Bacteroidota bacterium]